LLSWKRQRAHGVTTRTAALLLLLSPLLLLFAVADNAASTSASEELSSLDRPRPGGGPASAVYASSTRTD
jgi:hypothetical protein